MDWEKKFRDSGQPKVKLEIALNRLMEPVGLSGQWQQVYREYLSERSYPALMLLVRQGEPEKLRKFLAWGIAGGKQCRRVLTETSVENPEIRLILMGLDIPAGQMICQQPSAVSGRFANHLANTYALEYKREEEGSGTEILTLEDAAFQAWELTGASLALEIPYLQLFFGGFQVFPAPEGLGTGTDGLNIYLQFRQAVEYFQKQNLRELYLHTMAHVLYGHVLSHTEYPRKLWDLSCDISAWKLREKVFGLPVEGEEEREGLAALERLFPAGLELENAAAVCRALRHSRERQEQASILLKKLPQDAHEYWYGRSFPGKAPAAGGDGPGAGQPGGEQGKLQYLEQLQKKLDRARRYGDQLKRQVRPRRFGLAPGSRFQLLELRREGKYDFGRHLSRFASVKEELQTDEDSFDYAYYLLGLQRYGNMPLVEPLEYMEARKVEELVIAIDTSSSCSVEVVRRFLEETRNLLTRQENFFRKMNVHMIQCDSMIQHHQVITSVEDWQRYESQLKVVGRGGTDFTPVFSFVEKLRKEGELKDLKGLLYFTDGDGIYPRAPADYETIFVFSDRKFLEGNTARVIPPWVERVCLEEEGKP